MTTSPAASGIGDATISGWEASGIAYLAAAARLGRDLDGLPPGAPVTSSACLAPRYGVGTSTVNLATPATPPTGSPATGPQAPGPGHPPCLI